MVLPTPAVVSVSRGVLISPNATVLTVTLYRPRSLASAFVRPVTPAFAPE